MFSSPEILDYHRKLLDLPLPWEVRSVDVNVEMLAVTIDGFTALFEKMAAEILLSCKNQSPAAGLLRISWKQVHQIQVGAVEKALA